MIVEQKVKVKLNYLGSIAAKKCLNCEINAYFFGAFAPLCVLY